MVCLLGLDDWTILLDSENSGLWQSGDYRAFLKYRPDKKLYSVVLFDVIDPLFRGTAPTRDKAVDALRDAVDKYC